LEPQPARAAWVKLQGQRIASTRGATEDADDGADEIPVDDDSGPPSTPPEAFTPKYCNTQVVE
jgi:hypothetical protein